MKTDLFQKTVWLGLLMIYGAVKQVQIYVRGEVAYGDSLLFAAAMVFAGILTIKIVWEIVVEDLIIKIKGKIRTFSSGGD